MTKPNISWRNARLPDNTAVFAIGDIHAQCDLLAPLLAKIEEKINDPKLLPPGVKKHVVFIGDYIDRGTSGPRTIDMLMAFENKMKGRSDVEATFLCGNHEEVFTRILNAKGITGKDVGDPGNKEDYSHCLTNGEGELYLRGLEDNLFSGGGLTTLKNYWPDIDPTLFDEKNRCFNRRHQELNTPEKLIKKVNEIIKTYIEKVKAHSGHKEFFERAYI